MKIDFGAKFEYLCLIEHEVWKLLIFSLYFSLRSKWHSYTPGSWYQQICPWPKMRLPSCQQSGHTQALRSCNVSYGGNELLGLIGVRGVAILCIFHSVW